MLLPMVHSGMNALEQDLQAVNASVVRMLSMVRESVQLARRALIDADLEAVQLCVANDALVDAQQHELESRCLTIIVRRQPAARDLRFLGAVVQALADVERAGDYAVHVARAGADLAGQPRVKKYLDMHRILTILDEMLEVTMRAMADGDAEAARQALAMDEEIDELYDQIQRELLTYMMADPQLINRATTLLAVARYLERCGDHLENVNERIVFWVTGERL
ncbi:MAG: phosphate signaling complex protein PhoU [bacterium]|nr:phosphate signaling complex protein PhoU [bacterium]